MRKLALLAAVLLLGLASVAGPGPARGQAPPPGEWVPVIITLKSLPGAADEEAVRGIGGVVRHAFTTSPTLSVYLPAGAVEQAKRNPRFLNVQEDPIVTALEDGVPWGTKHIGADAVWGGAPGAVNVASGKPAGQGILVAVIDTGVQKNHPDLSANLAGGRNFVGSCFSFFCYAPDPNAWGDDNGHGTHVAGTIAMLDNGTGFIGVAPKASIYAIKVLNSQGSGRLSDVAAGIDHAVSVGVKVINLSLGCTGSGCDAAVLKASVDNAAAANVLVIAAAGNSGSGTDTVGYPAKYATAMAVAATCGPTNTSYCSGLDTRASFSSTGPAVEISAPGDAVQSAYNNGGYATMSGTSMATPHVAGVAALVLSCNPSLSASNVRNIMNSTSVDLGAAGRDNLFGFGRVSASAAAAAAGCTNGPDETPPETTITAKPASLTNSSSASFSFTSNEPGSTFECKLDAGAFTACTSPRAYSGLSDGEHTFQVRATDAAGNTDPTPAAYTWTIDTTPPETTITNGPSDNSGTSVSFSFVSSEGGSTFACRMDSGSWQSCTSPRSYTNLSAGSHTFQVRATDAAGNTDPTPATHTWTVAAPAVIAMHVGDLDGSRVLTSFLYWSATVVVTIHDASEQPVAGATVTAAWSGAASGTVTGTTNASGQVTFTRSNLSRFSSASSITLTVTNVTKSGYTYVSASNHDPDGDSNGTSITVQR